MEAENEVLVETQVAEQSEKTENAALIDFKMVTFSLAGKDYSIDIMNVKEIAKAGRFTYVPNTLPFVLGVYNLRGEIIPILDLRLFFNIDVPERDENKMENLLILNIDEQLFGIVVDKIDKVIGVQKSHIQPPHPLFGDINIKYIEGVIEANKRLYVLLDVTKIFAAKEAAEAGEKPALAYNPQIQQRIQAPQNAQKTSAPAAAPASASVDSKVEENFKFICESLQSYKKFTVSSVNESWIRHRLGEWIKQKGSDKVQLQNEADADEFLKPFWSNCNDAWWSKSYADAVAKLLPENAAKQIIIWNPGCGKGMETYSLACVAAKRYPGAKIRVYAQDVDLLAVSNASLMSVPSQLSSDWYGPYLTKKANGDYTFNQEIKDSIMFEYHDCKNANALPMVDVIFARDVLSLMDKAAQDTVIADFLEKMKGNAVAIIGENEAMPSSFNFGENTVDALVAYTKD